MYEEHPIFGIQLPQAGWKGERPKGHRADTDGRELDIPEARQTLLAPYTARTPIPRTSTDHDAQVVATSQRERD